MSHASTPINPTIGQDFYQALAAAAAKREQLKRESAANELLDRYGYGAPHAYGYDGNPIAYKNDEEKLSQMLASQEFRDTVGPTSAAGDYMNNLAGGIANRSAASLEHSRSLPALLQALAALRKGDLGVYGNVEGGASVTPEVGNATRAIIDSDFPARVGPAPGAEGEYTDSMGIHLRKRANPVPGSQTSQKRKTPRQLNQQYGGAPVQPDQTYIP